MKDNQDFRNHARVDPAFHFFVAPVLLLNVVGTIFVLVHHWPYRVLIHTWLVIVAVALVALATLARVYALRVQDRVIRLEERIRYMQLLSPETIAAAQGLSVKQVVALRFASDAELPGLVQRTLAEHLEPKAIKEAVKVWRSDRLRV